jgi:hypothetical protein
VHATVYCDCYERGRVHKSPPQPEYVYVEPFGQVGFKWDAPNADQFQFYGWLAEACEHGPMGALVFHRLGNIALIGFLRERLAETHAHFPVLLTKVLYSGTHGGDYLTLDDVSALGAEIKLLKTIHGRKEGDEEPIREFERKMFELFEAAQRIGKPICF